MRIILGGASDGDDEPVEREGVLFVRVFPVSLLAEKEADEDSRKGIFGAVVMEFATLLTTCTHHVIPKCNLE